MATNRELREEWYGCNGGENFVFLFDECGDIVSWCSSCKVRSWNAIASFEGKISHLIEAKESFKERHSNCKPKSAQEPQDTKPEQPTIQDFERRIHELADQVIDTVIRKHKDYDRSGLQVPALAPHITAFDALLVRQSCKYARLKHLLNKGTPEVKESILDTALDILGYDMLLAVEVERLMNV